jgi:hypothetical protein
VIGATSHVYVDDVSFTAASSFAPADFNQDAFVDVLDLLAWKGAFGITDAADADGDNDTDGADFLTWQREWEPTSSGAFASASVPEPTPIGFFTGLIAVFRRSRKTVS